MAVIGQHVVLLNIACPTADAKLVDISRPALSTPASPARLRRGAPTPAARSSHLTTVRVDVSDEVSEAVCRGATILNAARVGVLVAVPPMGNQNCRRVITLTGNFGGVCGVLDELVSVFAAAAGGGGATSGGGGGGSGGASARGDRSASGGPPTGRPTPPSTAANPTPQASPIAWRRQGRFAAGAAPTPAAAVDSEEEEGQQEEEEAAPPSAAAAAAAALDGAAAGGDEDEDVDELLVCPISHTSFVDPVSTVDGFTYERKVIEAWLEKHSTSPITGLELPSKLLVPNVLVRQMVAKAAAGQRPTASLEP